jgi:serine/threonine-protein kinase
MPQLGRYEILQQLARGSIADVLLARATGQAGFARHVVIKRIRPELAVDARFVKAFLDEARIGASLNHQNIVQVFDVGQDGSVYFAMEYVHGEDARKLLIKVREMQAQVPIDQIVAIGMAVATGLHHAHELVGPDRRPIGLVHRDVSPPNILIGYDGSVKLVDFALAKAALRSATTRTGVISGKAPYMSPELCLGKPVDRRSDIFSLGIVLYELATARRLFKGDNDFLTMAAIVEGDVAPPSTYRPELPRRLDEIIMRALAKAPEARFQNAHDFQAALESLAIDMELRTSAKPLADYMTSVFGPRVEPWQTQSTPVAIDSSVDFDDAPSGLVDAPPTSNELRHRLATDAISPLAIARNVVEHRPDPGFESDEEPTRAMLDPPTDAEAHPPLMTPDQEDTATVKEQKPRADDVATRKSPAMGTPSRGSRTPGPGVPVQATPGSGVPASRTTTGPRTPPAGVPALPRTTSPHAGVVVAPPILPASAPLQPVRGDDVPTVRNAAVPLGEDSDPGDEATTVSPPLFPIQDPIEAMPIPDTASGAQQVVASQLPSVVVEHHSRPDSVVYVGPSAPKYLTPRYLLAIAGAVLVLILIGLLARACSSDAPAPPDHGAHSGTP